MSRTRFAVMLAGVAIGGAAIIGVTRQRPADAQFLPTPPGFVQLACAQPAVQAAYTGFCAPFGPTPTPVPTTTPVPTATPCPFFLCPPTPGPTPAPGPMTVQVIILQASGAPVLPGTTVAANVGGVPCASTQTTFFNRALLPLPPSCGAAGAPVSFTVGGVSVSQGTTFVPGGSTAIVVTLP